MKYGFAVPLLISLLVVISACTGKSDETSTFPVELTDKRVTSGEEIYSANCALCHGPVNGPVALESAPVHGDAGHTWHHPDRLLHQWILDSPPLATVMPAFRGTLSEEEVLDVLAYIKSHWLPEIQERQASGSAQYEAQIVEDRAG